MTRMIRWPLVAVDPDQRGQSTEFVRRVLDAKQQSLSTADWREVLLMLTALVPIYAAAQVARVPPVTGFPNWLNEVVGLVCWALLCRIFVDGWARLLHLVRLLDNDQFARYPFGLGAGRN